MDSFFVLEVLGVELRASHFLGRHYTSWATSALDSVVLIKTPKGLYHIDYELIWIKFDKFCLMFKSILWDYELFIYLTVDTHCGKMKSILKTCLKQNMKSSEERKKAKTPTLTTLHLPYLTPPHHIVYFTSKIFQICPSFST
jgi:hypothetical protein